MQIGEGLSYIPFGYDGLLQSLRAEVERLREENAFLKELIKDLKAESTAYRRGIEDGWHGTVGGVGRGAK